jgi:hypothetical protein
MILLIEPSLAKPQDWAFFSAYFFVGDRQTKESRNPGL